MAFLRGPTSYISTISIGALLCAIFINNPSPIVFPSILIDNSERVADVLILGGSHAGLAGALTLTRHQHDVIIFDDGKPRNHWNTPIRVVPTWNNRLPSDLRASSRKELYSTGLATFVDESAVRVTKIHDSLFQVTTSNEKLWSGKKLLIATGVEFQFPNIAGYSDIFPERM